MSGSEYPSPSHLQGISRLTITSRWYRSLSSQTRLLIGVGIMGYAGIGMLLSDRVEAAFGMVPTEQEKDKLSDALPKFKVMDKNDVQIRGRR